MIAVAITHTASQCTTFTFSDGKHIKNIANGAMVKADPIIDEMGNTWVKVTTADKESFKFKFSVVTSPSVLDAQALCVQLLAWNVS